MISIVMLTYNNNAKFSQCVHSLFPFMMDDRIKEIIILDNGSHEMSLIATLKSLNRQVSKVRVMFGTENLGIAKGRKLLYEEAKGDYILSFDSDVAIVNPNIFLEVFFNCMKDESIWLVGGGGGNHTFFPSLELDDVNNLPSPEDPKQVLFLDEVAGWFHGFRASMLTHNGGKIYMDEQFSPFWGEDSDFCFQIRQLGGKCCIMGKGLIAHTWSSCDKEEIRTGLHEKWEQLVAKWYPKFGDMFKFEHFDKDFYLENYEQDFTFKHPRSHYFKFGSTKGYVPCREFVEKLYDVKFLSNTELEYQGKEYKTTTFVDDFLTYKKLSEQHFKVVDDKLRDGTEIVFFTSSDQEKSLPILRKLSETNDSLNIAFSFTEGADHTKCIDFITNTWTNYHISQFYNYFNHEVHFMLLFKQLSRHNFKYYLKAHSDMSLENELLSVNLTSPGYLPDEGMIDSKDKLTNGENKFNFSSIGFVLDSKQDFVFSKSGCFINDYSVLKRNCDSYPYNVSLENALRIPIKYDNYVMTRASPHHTLLKLVPYIHHYTRENNKTLIVCLQSLDIEEEIETVRKNIDLLRSSGSCEKEVLFFNCGSLKNVKMSALGADYYYKCEEPEYKYFILRNLKELVELDIYDSIICVLGDITLEEKIDDFAEQSMYRNLCLYKENDKFNLDIFSITKNSWDEYVEFFVNVSAKHKESLKQGKPFNYEDTLQINLKQLFKLGHIWNCSKKEEDYELVYSFYKERERVDSEEDFPLVF